MRQRSREDITPPPQGSIRFRDRVQSGQILLEIGLIFPALLLIIVAVVDFGRIFMVQQVITNGAREGAWYAINGDAETSDVQARVQTYLAESGLDVEKATINVSGTNAATAEPTQVAISYATSSLLMKMLHLDYEFNLTSASVMLHE